MSLPCPRVSRDTAITPERDRVPVSLSIDTGHGHGVIETKGNAAMARSVSPERNAVKMTHPHIDQTDRDRLDDGLTLDARGAHDDEEKQ